MLRAKRCIEAAYASKVAGTLEPYGGRFLSSGKLTTAASTEKLNRCEEAAGASPYNCDGLER